MKYSEYIATHRDNFWKSDAAKYINDKREGKKLARKLGLECPKDYLNVVVKPTNSYGGRGVQMLPECENLMCEEYIPHNFDFRLYTFWDKCPFVQIDKSYQSDSRTIIHDYSYWEIDNWNRIYIDKTEKNREVHMDKPVYFDIMLQKALEFTKYFSLPVRVDFFALDDKFIFNEFCVTPGLVVTNRITNEADEWLGSFCE